jgi:hypothetical protein
VFVFFRAAEDRREALWYAGAFLLGLSFTNHMTTILLVPGLLYMYVAHFGSRRSSWNRLLRLLPIFLLGLSLYIYLPLRAAVPPALNWGDPSTLERLFWHLRGKQYSVWIFSSTEVTGRQLTHFLTSLPAEFAYAGLMAALIGLVVLWRTSRKAAITTILFCVVCVLYAVNYDIQDIDSYFLLAYIMIGVWGGCGLLAVGYWWIRVWRWNRTLVGALLLLSGILPLGVHYREVDQSENRMVEDYTRNVFHSLAPNALVLSYQWDYWVSASYYYQQVRSFRRDVSVVDKELLRRSWYLRELEVQKPWLIRSSQIEVDAFRRELQKFEKGVPYDPAGLRNGGNRSRIHPGVSEGAGGSSLSPGVRHIAPRTPDARSACTAAGAKGEIRGYDPAIVRRGFFRARGVPAEGRAGGRSQKSLPEGFFLRSHIFSCAGPFEHARGINRCFF